MVPGDDSASAVDAILVPLIFVGMGLLLFGVGIRLHLVHPNPVRQLRRRPEEEPSHGADGRDS